MNYPIIFRLLGVITTAIAFAFLCCMCVGVYYRTTDEIFAIDHWGGCFLFVLALAIIFFILGRKASPKMLRKEGLCVIGVGWILATVLGAIPFWMFIEEFSFFDALFESASGLTTTGATVLAEPEKLHHSLLFWRAMAQWIGGLGIVVFFVAILSYLGVGAKVLFSNESSGQVAEMDSSRVQKGIMSILILYLALSVLCAATFYMLGMDLFDAVTHMFTTVATGGFSTHSESIAYFQSPVIEWVTIVYMIIGGTSFFLLLQFLNFNFEFVKNNTEFKVYLLVIVGFTLITAFIFHQEASGDPSVERSLRVSAFQVVSILTSTGYSTIDFDLWVPAAQLFLMMLMVSGACSGSTAGGLKLIRSIVAFKATLLHIEKSFRSRIVRTININKKPLGTNAEESIVLYIVMGAIIFFVSLFLLALFEDEMSFKGMVSAVLACIGNIGPAFAEVGPTKNYQFLTNESKLLLSLVMIVGRLEFYAILVLFAPSFWRRFS